MSPIEGLMIFLSILVLYFLAVFSLHKLGILEKYNISLYGPALLLRTKKGRNFLKKLASKKRFWKAYGSSGILLCFIMMVVMVLLLIWQVWAVSGFTAEQIDQIPGIEFVIVLPGINPILPLEHIWFILLAFVIALVVHEFSHGILTLASKLKVKSLGILYFIVPVGAFCEPDEEQLKKTKTSNRMRVYAAGPTSNFAVVLIVIILLSFIFMSAVQPSAEGPVVFSIDEGSPAELIGIAPGSTVTSFNDTNITSVLTYFVLLNHTTASQTVNITYVKSDQTFTEQVELLDKYEEWAKRADIYPVNNESYREKGYLGISSLLRDGKREEHLSILKNPFTQFPDGFLFFYVLPLFGYLQGYNPITAPFNEAYVVTGPLSVIPTNIFWGIINALYWIFWLNLAVALFNVLPMIPLDGGFLFNDAIGSFIKRLKKDISDEQREKAVKNVSIILSLIILFMVLFPFLIKYF